MHTITVPVSYVRGPLDEVVWDQPNRVFVDSLVTAGYGLPRAHAIAPYGCAATRPRSTAPTWPAR